MTKTVCFVNFFHRNVLPRVLHLIFTAFSVNNLYIFIRLTALNFTASYYTLRNELLLIKQIFCLQLTDLNSSSIWTYTAFQFTKQNTAKLHFTVLPLFTVLPHSNLLHTLPQNLSSPYYKTPIYCTV